MSTETDRHAEWTASLPDFGGLYQLVHEPLRCRVAEAAVGLAIFDHLGNPTTAETVAVSMGIHADNTRIFLDGLTAMGLVQKRRGEYQNTPVAEAFLVRGRTTYLGDFLRDQVAVTDRPAEDLMELVRHGPPAVQTGAADAESLWGDMARHYANYLRAGVSKRYLDVFEGITELQEPRRFLDLGGGPGVTAIAMAATHPLMHAAVFDVPAVAAVAQEMITHYGLTDRVTVIAGDYMQDDLGDGYDLVFAGFTLNYARADLDAMLRRIRGAMSPGGFFVCAGDGLTDERTKPEYYVVGMLPWALAGQDMGFDQGEVADAMRRAGFDVLRSCREDWAIGPVDIDVARRPDTARA